MQYVGTFVCTALLETWSLQSSAFHRVRTMLLIIAQDTYLLLLSEQMLVKTKNYRSHTNTTRSWCKGREPTSTRIRWTLPFCTRISYFFIRLFSEAAGRFKKQLATHVLGFLTSIMTCTSFFTELPMPCSSTRSGTGSRGNLGRCHCSLKSTGLLMRRFSMMVALRVYCGAVTPMRRVLCGRSLHSLEFLMGPTVGKCTESVRNTYNLRACLADAVHEQRKGSERACRSKLGLKTRARYRFKSGILFILRVQAGPGQTW